MRNSLLALCLFALVASCLPARGDPFLYTFYLLNPATGIGPDPAINFTGESPTFITYYGYFPTLTCDFYFVSPHPTPSCDAVSLQRASYDGGFYWNIFFFLNGVSEDELSGLSYYFFAPGVRQRQFVFTSVIDEGGTTATPEPGTFALLGTGLLGLGVGVRRRWLA